MLKFRTFTREDWQFFGGAERLSDGSNPLIADAIIPTKVDKEACLSVIIDKQGIEISLLGVVEEAAYTCEVTDECYNTILSKILLLKDLKSLYKLMQESSGTFLGMQKVIC